MLCILHGVFLSLPVSIPAVVDITTWIKIVASIDADVVKIDEIKTNESEFNFYSR